MGTRGSAWGGADHLPGTRAALTAQGSSPGSSPPTSEVLWEQDQVTAGLARSQTGTGALVTDMGAQPALGRVTGPASLLMARRDPPPGKFLPEVGSVLLSCAPTAPLQLWTEPLCRAAPRPVSGHLPLAPLPGGPRPLSAGSPVLHVANKRDRGRCPFSQCSVFRAYPRGASGRPS